jgi:hypothetical protein
VMLGEDRFKCSQNSYRVHNEVLESLLGRPFPPAPAPVKIVKTRTSPRRKYAIPYSHNQYLTAPPRRGTTLDNQRLSRPTILRHGTVARRLSRNASSASSLTYLHHYHKFPPHLLLLLPPRTLKMPCLSKPTSPVR